MRQFGLPTEMDTAKNVDLLNSHYNDPNKNALLVMFQESYTTWDDHSQVVDLTALHSWHLLASKDAASPTSSLSSARMKHVSICMGVRERFIAIISVKKHLTDMTTIKDFLTNLKLLKVARFTTRKQIYRC